MAYLALDRDDSATAHRQVTEAIGHALEAMDMPVLARAVVASAALRAHQGDARAAAEVLGAAEQLRGAPDRFSPDVARLARRLRHELGDAAYDAALALGRDLDRADALDRVQNLNRAPTL